MSTAIELVSVGQIVVDLDNAELAGVDIDHVILSAVGMIQLTDWNTILIKSASIARLDRVVAHPLPYFVDDKVKAVK